MGFENSSGARYIGVFSDRFIVGTGPDLSSTGQMTLDSSGNLGLGVTPSAWNLGRAVEAGAIGNALWGVNATQCNVTQNTYYSSGFKYASTNPATYYSQISGSHIWYNAPSGTAGNAISFTQAMTLDAIGNFLVGATALSSNATYFSMSPGNGFADISHQGTGVSGLEYIRFMLGGTKIGSVTQSGTTAVLYNVTSDYRLKTVIGPVADAGQRIDALRPVEYTWNSDGSRTRGFLADQFQEVYADSVTGTKDAVDAEGKPVYQTMQASTPEVIADLVAELQSLRARVAQLEAK
jgi:hypothetical protein